MKMFYFITDINYSNTTRLFDAMLIYFFTGDPGFLEV